MCFILRLSFDTEKKQIASQERTKVVTVGVSDPDPDPGFLTKNRTKLTSEKKIFYLFFLIKNSNLLIPRPPLRSQSYKRSLQPSKENN
jgi:hypothetical protein